MTSLERRSRIQAILSESDHPISASTLAKQFGVSRQTIVGDVSLLRASGDPIIATLRGYEYDKGNGNEAILVCRHFPSDTAKEMKLIVDNGGVIKDVIVDHPLYGHLKGELQISTVGDINLFMGKLKQQEGHLLSELTGGVHMHTIGYETPAQLKAIREALKGAGFLYE